MGREKSSTRTADAPSPSELDLTVTVQSRVSPRAKAMVRDSARRGGVSPSTWIRVTIYKALGLIKE